MLHLFDTATRTLRPFVSRMPGEVQLFVCGPTVYDMAHAGHAKTYTQFDLIARYLARTHRVNYLLNFTDIDDKLIQRAAKTGRNVEDLARYYERQFQEDMRWLGNDAVTQVAQATRYMPAIIDQVQRLINQGVGYQLADGWYFDLAQAAHYGTLSRNNYSEEAPSRVATQGKRNPGDFAIWKFSKPGEPAWTAAFGAGRPGWHIEDTAITEQIFRPQYDIHGGAVDLIFPHHEAEIVQMETLSGKNPMVNYWLHTGLLLVNGEKMSKSLNNFTTVRDLAQQVNPRTLRYLFLSQHYRSQFNLDEHLYTAAETARQRLQTYYWNLGTGQQTADEVDALRERIYTALDEDINTPQAFAELYDFIRHANRTGTNHGQPMRKLLTEFNNLFKVLDLNPADQLDAAISNLIKQRQHLRATRQYTAADQIRTLLQTQHGITLEDSPTGTQVLQNGKPYTPTWENRSNQ